MHIYTIDSSVHRVNLKQFERIISMYTTFIVYSTISDINEVWKSKTYLLSPKLTNPFSYRFSLEKRQEIDYHRLSRSKRTIPK